MFNIGNNKPIALMSFIVAIDKAAGKAAKKNYIPMQAGDVPATFADIDSLQNEVGFKLNTNIEYVIQQFVDWFRLYKNEE